jgi:hypothetical protein
MKQFHAMDSNFRVAKFGKRYYEWTPNTREEWEKSKTQKTLDLFPCYNSES